MRDLLRTKDIHSVSEREAFITYQRVMTLFFQVRSGCQEYCPLSLPTIFFCFRSYLCLILSEGTPKNITLVTLFIRLFSTKQRQQQKFNTGFLDAGSPSQSWLLPLIVLEDSFCAGGLGNQKGASQDLRCIRNPTVSTI